MNAIKYTNLFIGTLVILSCTLLIITFGYINIANNSTDVITIAQTKI